MKYKLLFIATLIVSMMSCDVRKKDKLANSVASNTQKITDTATVQIIDSVYDFGKINEGEKKEYSYRFKNIGQKPLIITNTAPSCGCTIAEKPEQPVLPGETGYIKIIFNSAHKVGKTHKTIGVSSNAFPPFPELVLTGEVLPKQ